MTIFKKSCRCKKIWMLFYIPTWRASSYVHRDKIRVWSDKCREKSRQTSKRILGPKIAPIQDRISLSFNNFVQAIKIIKGAHFGFNWSLIKFWHWWKIAYENIYNFLVKMFRLRLLTRCSALLYCCVPYIIINKRYIRFDIE